jgi:DNA-directed RNA polymerase specialized sigma24 family protein
MSTATLQTRTGETMAEVRRVLDQLEPKGAQLLRAAFLEERDRNELCREYGVDRAYLRVLLHRAKEKFRSAYPQREKLVKMKPRDTETADRSLRH